MKPRFFSAPAEFRAWLEEHHETAGELLVGFHKKGTGEPSMTWPESVEQALRFGWIAACAAASTRRATRSASPRARPRAPGAR